MKEKSRKISFASLACLDDYWRGVHGISDWLITDIYKGLSEKFVHEVIITDETSFHQLRGKPVLYIANHQTAIESLLFIYLIGGLSQSKIVAIAKEEHRNTWIGKLHQHSTAHPEGTPHESMIYFDRKSPGSFLTLLQTLNSQHRDKSILIHTEGTRAQSCREKTSKVSRRVIQMAIQAELPMVPVRFAGGLPVAKSENRLNFPIGYGAQSYYIGSPIHAKEIKHLSHTEQKDIILQSINQLGIPVENELPSHPDESFQIALECLMQALKIPQDLAILLKVLQGIPHPSAETARLLACIDGQDARWHNNPTDQWLSGLRPCFDNE